MKKSVFRIEFQYKKQWTPQRSVIGIYLIPEN